MSLYEFLLFVHIVAAALWFGAGMLMQVQATRADSIADDASLQRVIEDSVWLATRLFIPASLIVLLAGFGMVAEGDWSLGSLWLVLGLVGYATTFATGMGVIKPRSEHIQGLIERDGGMSPEAAYESRRLFALTRIDYVVLLLVLFDMVVKPSGDDGVLLLIMAAVLVAGAAYTIAKANAITQPVTANR